jgi:hypothetical protein
MLHRARSAILSRMNLSSIPFTSPVGKLLRLPLRVVPKRAIVPVLQGELRGRVESLAENVAYLKRHLDLNGVRNVEVWPAAVADKEGEEPFAAAGDRSQGKLGGEGPHLMKNRRAAGETCTLPPFNAAPLVWRRGDIIC